MIKPNNDLDKGSKQQKQHFISDRSPSKQGDQYFQRVKAIYQGKTNRPRYSQNSEYKEQGISQFIDRSSYHQSPKRGKQGYSSSASGIDLINKSADQSPSLINSKLRTQNENQSPKKKFFHNKVQKQRKFQNQWQNDRMMKRLNEIRNRKNKYMKESQQLMQFEKQHKSMHESSVLANKKLLQIQIEQNNDKFIDRLVERVKYKQTIKPTVMNQIQKSVKLDESRAKVAIGSRISVQLPPMIFDSMQK